MLTKQDYPTTLVESLKAWLDVGVSPELSDSQRRRQYIVNATPVIITSAVLLYLLIFWLVGSQALVRTAIYELPVVLVGVLWFRWCQHQNHPAHYWEACAICQVTVLIGIVSGQGTLINTHFYFLLFSLTAPLIIPITDRTGMSLVCMECMLVYLTLEYFQWPASADIQALSVHEVKILKLSVTTTCCSILFVAFFFSEMIANTLESRMKKLASCDELTGLANRRAFRDAIVRAVSFVRRHKSKLCLAILDVDFFKKVNDTYGHDTGDEVLKLLAKLLQESARTSDLVARYGGEEFIILMPGCDIKGAQEVCERIRALVEQSELKTKSFCLKATISVGVAEFTSNMDENKLLALADSALYLAKERGRNQVVKSNNCDKSDSA
ncbi:GGDEF domain-containing protein [Rhodoferax mekongensis]|uniref:GGDEF domain-containing protein n=1 Tax=Rhodoferax mekongensis TaxID=3068341 RepID=UPI0028BE6B5F|nr:GGDEF domain-containing protein [Rhodoferax sp. TBRC 17199]MDT7517104.1 GGDEF domain-containing protein [Rhodoferax sp. TBRC 17199]